MSVATFFERTRGARKILIVDLGFLGDSVHLIPACWDLKRQYPDAELHTLSATVGAEVLKLAPCVDRAWAYPLGNPSPPWWRHLDILGAIRRERFDVAISFSGGDRPVLVTALSAARHRLAHDNGRRHFYNRWIVPDWVPRRDRRDPVFEQRRQVLAAAGMALGPVRFDLDLPWEVRDWARDQMAGGAIHVSPNASHVLKEWPMESWRRLIPVLTRATGRPVVVTGDGSEREQRRLKRLEGAVGGATLRVIQERLSLARLAALLEQSALHVGADSGVTHLAFALGRPTVTVYREYDGRLEWTPPGPRHRQCIVECACIGGQPKGCLSAEVAACLGGIQPEAMLEHCVRALEGG
ncbi:MAG: glycosyltransferase family 9 protein [Verrucomicrobiae bacterium]|nr:glycosyltransferase family 9 protein [Verrucomicrobiae bacterium]